MALVLVWQIARKEAKEGATRNVALNEESPKSQRRRTVKVIVGEHSRPTWKLGRVVEGATLEMLLGGYPYESSNLSVSATGCSAAW